MEKDLKELVRRGYFPFGFVDDETGCFWANNAVWRLKNPQRAKEQDERARTSRAAERKKRRRRPLCRRKAPLPCRAKAFCAGWTPKLKR